jgi:hypothetical protein
MRIRSRFYPHGVRDRRRLETPSLAVATRRKWSFYRSADVKTRSMSRLGKKNCLARIPSAPRTRTLHSRPPLYRFQEIFHAIKTGRYPNRNAKLLLQLSASLGYSQPVECGCLPPQSPTVNREPRSAN